MSPKVQLDSDELDAQVLATSAVRQVLVTTLDAGKTAGISDDEHSTLLHLLQSDNKSWPENIAAYKRFSQEMSTVEGIVLFKGRVVIPTILRQQVLDSLHDAHQGTSGMTLWSHESVWWPGISEDIQNTRNSCKTCNKNAPSQSPLPPYPLHNPQYPFQMISSDYFTYNGHNYLIIVDRYSNWPSVKR